MKVPLVGVTPRLLEEDKNIKVQVNTLYLTPLSNRCLNYIILPLEPVDLQPILDLCDGFLMVGGDDIDPRFYHEDNSLGLSKNIDSRVDCIDQQVIHYAIKTGKPLLGICRGIQALAVFCGGSLYQDMDSVHLKHEVKNHEHEVYRVLNTDFTVKLPTDFTVNSYHHQAIKKIPLNFDIIYRYQDVIEGIEHRYLPIIGIQWHPEKMKRKESAIIFDYFYEMIHKYHNGF